MSEEQKAREDEVFNQELSLEDLDAAAGGRVLHHKDNRIKEADLHNCIERHCRPIYGPDGNSFPYCAATVEDGSWCDSNDACYTDQSVRYEGRKDCAKAWRQPYAEGAPSPQRTSECRDCKYRLYCGTGCRACACGETGTDYLGIDEEACSFFEHGWFEKAQEMRERYKDCFPPAEAEAAEGAKHAEV